MNDDRCTVAMRGTITGYNSDVVARFGKALAHVAEDIEYNAGEFSGVAKVVFTAEDGSSVAIVLTNLSRGVEQQGVMDPCEKVHFDYEFTAAEVAEATLGHTMFHALDDIGLDYEMDEDSKYFIHHHDHDHHEHGHYKHDHHEPTSPEQAGGCAVSLSGTITGYNADAEAKFADALLKVGLWVTEESGCLLGHIKAAVVKEDRSGITLNLTDVGNGVEHHGTLEPQEKVSFTFMCAVLDVEEHELRHRMYHAIDDTGLDYKLEEYVECHCYDHKHHHHDGEGCHDHDEGHHHEDGECRCLECETKKVKEGLFKKKEKSFLNRLRRKKE